MKSPLVVVTIAALALMPLSAEEPKVRSRTHGGGEVEVTGTGDATTPGWGTTSPARSRQPTSEAPAASTADVELENCTPRIRTFEGEDHSGHVCDAGSEILWIPDTDADPADPGAAPAPPLVVTAQDVQTLLVNTGTIQVQPDRSWVLVNAETIVHTDAAEHTLTTQVLGIDVDVRVTPTQFTWDFGDSTEPVTRTDPGAPWPEHTTAHKYRSTGDYQITLRTEWDAHFRVQGTRTWRPVTGTPVTVATSEPFQAVTATPRLTG